MSIIPEACFFTGHRVIEETDALSEKLKDAITAMIENGVSIFICGGALGFDTLAAEAVLKLKEKYEITLCLYLPCDDQTDGWEIDDIFRYNMILSSSDEVFYVSHGTKSPALMKKRNRAMVEAADYCICYMKNPSSGTGQTVRMAEEKGIEVINLYEIM